MEKGNICKDSQFQHYYLRLSKSSTGQSKSISAVPQSKSLNSNPGFPVMILLMILELCDNSVLLGTDFKNVIICYGWGGNLIM